MIRRLYCERERTMKVAILMCAFSVTVAVLHGSAVWYDAALWFFAGMWAEEVGWRCRAVGKSE